MKTINPINIWYNGQTIAATIFSMTSISDNLQNSATFYYQLFSASMQQLFQGNLSMDATTYASYNTSPNGSDFAYTWAATQLGITITGNYVPPTAEAPKP